jgi:hypothetical protein
MPTLQQIACSAARASSVELPIHRAETLVGHNSLNLTQAADGGSGTNGVYCATIGATLRLKICSSRAGFPHLVR